MQNLKLIYLIIAALLGLICAFADYLIKLSASGKKFMEWKWFVLAVLIYIGSAFGWFFLVKNIKLYTLGIFYTIPLIIGLALLDIFYFKDPVNFFEIAGITLAVISLILLAKFA